MAHKVPSLASSGLLYGKDSLFHAPKGWEEVFWLWGRGRFLGGLIAGTCAGYGVRREIRAIPPGLPGVGIGFIDANIDSLNFFLLLLLSILCSVCLAFTASA